MDVEEALQENRKERLCRVIWYVKKAVWAYGLDGRGEGGRRKVKKGERTNGYTAGN